MTAVTVNLQHEDFCLPQPGEFTPRIEGYRLPRYGPDSTTQVGSVAVVRCCECAAASYDGVQRG